MIQVIFMFWGSWLSKYLCLSTKIRFKKDKSNEYVIGWKSKGVYNSKHTPLQRTILPEINHYASKIGIHSFSCGTK